MVAKGWVSRDDLGGAVRHRGQLPDEADLCAVLVGAGLLTREQSRVTRAAVERELARLTAAGRGRQAGDKAPEPSPVRRGGARRPSTDRMASSQDVRQQLRSLVADSSHKELDVGPPLKVGRRFEGYELEGELSRGAMGVVFRAADRNHDRSVAIKFMHKQLPGAAGAARFKREVGILARLEHPNIVRILDYGSREGLLYFVMELIDGRDLRSLVDQGARRSGGGLAWPQVLSLLTPIAEAIVYCHEIGVVHRDLKPQNIVVERDTSRAVLLDFGLVKKDKEKLGESIASQGQSLTQLGEMVGTPAYMSPEQYSPGGTFGSVSAKTDVWGFGATLFHALSGMPPYNRPTALEIFQAMMQNDPPSLLEVGADVPGWLDELVGRCLRREGPERPTMAEVLGALERAAESVSDAAVSSVSASGSSGHYGRRATAPSSARGRLLAVFVGLVLLLGLMLFSFSSPARFETLVADSWTREAVGVVSGRVSGPRGADLVTATNLGVRRGSEVQAELGEGGSFRFDVALIEGRNRVSVTLRFQGRPLERRELIIHRDTVAPLIVLDQEAPRGPYVLGPSLLLTGRVKDANPARLFRGEEAVSLGPAGAFELPIEDREEPQSYTLRAVDQVGREGRLELEVLTPKAIARGHELVGRHLESAEAWRACPEDAARAVSEEVARRLGGGFEHRGLERTARGSWRSLFVHLQTRVELLLLPGGLYRMGLSRALVDELERSRLELAKRERSVRTLDWGLAWLPRAQRLRAECLKVEGDASSFQRWRRGLSFALLYDGVGRAPGAGGLIEGYRRRLGSPEVTSLDELVERATGDPARFEELRSELLDPWIVETLLRVIALAPVYREALNGSIGLSPRATAVELRVALESDEARLWQAFRFNVENLGKMVLVDGSRRKQARRQRGPEDSRMIEALRERHKYWESAAPRPVEVAPFLIGRRELTEAEWERGQGGGGFGSGSSRPRVRVTRAEVVRWLGQIGGGLRLPSEREWEFACRAGSEERYPWGTAFAAERIWYKNNSKRRPHSVKGREDFANAYGLVDTLGNVAEMCAGRWSSSPEETRGVTRGGSFTSSEDEFGCGLRMPLDGELRASHIGLRLAVSLPRR